MGKLQINRKVLGMVQTNCYLLINNETQEVVLVDPADQAKDLIAAIEQMKLKPAAILLTHGHFDHIGAVGSVAAHFQIPVYAGTDEADMLQDADLNLSGQLGTPMTVKVNRFLADQETFTVAGFAFKVFHTPGHTKGGVCYYIEADAVLFSGDTLFRDSIGRTDLPTGNMSALVRSVQNLLAVLPDETAVYPGHEAETSAGHEKKYNPYL